MLKCQIEHLDVTLKDYGLGVVRKDDMDIEGVLIQKTGQFVDVHWLDDDRITNEHPDDLRWL